ncbi:methyl-accepting chemotaxis protein [Mesorhizobium sp. L-8-10]|uniref:methyl-accepting chemotaxis protein n=1 Tax=Mesorhizobium sp. L-8-10 TaxID=2744523 RepID=UPI001935EA23|nr:methyl-accepting chemotaxis protein [Mesorhizobium sp. L-8-10]BCH30206.1 methyl-accepting chemotaxis protein [Mesorhizobium sp. L-8-10]
MHAKSVKLPQLKLRGTIVLAAAAVFTIALANMLFYVVRSTAKSDLAAADQLLGSIARAEANNVDMLLKRHWAVAESISQTVTTLVSDPMIGPDAYRELLARQMTIVPDAVGIWVLLNKDAPSAANPDLMASSFARGDGYFGPNIVRDVQTGEIRFSDLDLSMENGFKDWFLDPLAKGKPTLMGPYLYNDLLYTSTIAIVRDRAGKPVGLAGVDFNGGVFASLIGTHRPLGTGWVGIINQDKNWVVPPEAALIGKPAEDATARAAVAGARTGSFHETIPVNDVDWRVTSTELDLPEFGAAWTVLVGVPEETLLADAVGQRNILLLGGALVLALGLVAFTWLGASIAKPVSRMTTAMRRIAENDYAAEVPYGDRRDEIGDMAKALGIFRSAGIEKQRLEMEADEARRTIDGERSVREAETAESQRAAKHAVDVLGDGLHRLADGDLVQRIQTQLGKGADELRVDFNLSVEKLQQTMLGIHRVAGAIRTGLSEISAAADDLSHRSSQQAASLEETAASLNQITETVRQTADGANHARRVVASTRSDAVTSAEVVRQAIEAMGQIEKSSHEIGSIIGVIDEIAFQTNLLALNAGVEAARAGEAGRGFAVVASEVRSLAQRSAEAAKEIKSLIANSSSQVDAGVRLVVSTGDALKKIMTQVNEINDAVVDIAAKTAEQATSLREVNVAVNQMDQVTQQNAAMVEETTAASHTLSGEAAALVRLVGQFKVGSEAAAASHAPAPRQPAPRPAAVRGNLALKPVAEADGWEEF